MGNGEEDKETLIPETTLEDLEAKTGARFCVAVIPCKTSSSRLPDKNFLEVEGRPMMLWAVMKAMSCPYIDVVCISTDNYDLLLEKVPSLNAKMFDDVVCAPRKADVSHPDTPIFLVVHAALKTMAEHDAFKDVALTHVVMLQPNVPSLQQEVVNDLVRAVVEGEYNVARHFVVSFEEAMAGKEWVGGPMTGGCDAYKVGALFNPAHMDSYNYAVMTADPEIHTQEDLELARKVIAGREKDVQQS